MLRRDFLKLVPVPVLAPIFSFWPKSRRVRIVGLEIDWDAARDDDSRLTAWIPAKRRIELFAMLLKADQHIVQAGRGLLRKRRLFRLRSAMPENGGMRLEAQLAPVPEPVSWAYPDDAGRVMVETFQLYGAFP